MTGQLAEAGKLAGVSVWVVAACWLCQSHIMGRAEAAREAEYKARTEAVLARATPALRTAGNIATRAVIGAEGLPERVADRVDRLVRKGGVSRVRLVGRERDRVFWVVMELARRGYDEEELLLLLGVNEEEGAGGL